MMPDLRSLLDYAKRQGARDAELYLEETSNWNCRVYEGRVDDVQASSGNGLGVRVTVGDSLGTAFTSDLRDQGCREAVDRAIANAGIAEPDPLREFYSPAQSDVYPTLRIYDEALDRVTPEEKIALALRMESMASGRHPLIRKVLSSGIHTRSQRVTVINTRGVDAFYRSNALSAFVSVLASNGGAMQGGHGSAFARKWEEIDAEKVVDEAVNHAVSLLGGQPVESQDAAVIFDRGIAAQIWGMLGRTLAGEEARKGRSIFAGRLGQKVASPLVTLIDDSLRPDSPGACPFDVEGVPKRTFPLIEEGVLKGFVYDVYTAKKAGTVSTGHARRSFRSSVSAAPENLYMKPGQMSVDDLIASTENGFLVMEVKGLGVGGFNVVTGDMSVGASGLWIKAGKVVGPVREVTVAGNWKEMLMEVDAVANDFKWSGVGAPSFRVRKMAVSGR